MTVFAGVCSVTSCPFNLGNGRVACDWLRNGRGRCHHPQFREAWQAAYELEQAQAGEAVTILEPAPVVEMQRLPARPFDEMQELPARVGSLTGRAVAASTPMDAARARQMLLDLGEV